MSEIYIAHPLFNLFRQPRVADMAHMSEGRVLRKLKHTYPTNRKQMEAILATLTNDQLKNHCRSLGVVGYSTLIKEKLVERLMKEWSEGEVISNSFVVYMEQSKVNWGGYVTPYRGGARSLS